MMRNILAATALALVLAACGGGNDASKPADNSSNSGAEKSLSDHAKDVTDSAKDAAKEIGDAAGDAANDIKESASDMAKDAGDAASDLMKQAGEAANNAGEAVKEALSDEAKAAADAAILASLPAPYNEASVKDGEKVFRQCKTCHLVNNSGKNLVGPNLYGVIGQHAAKAEKFNYSKAMQEADIVWTPETLDAYLASPRSYIEGNRMSFAGLAKENDRKNVIAYLAVSGGVAPTE